jgi:hypothetical protein
MSATQRFSPADATTDLERLCDRWAAAYVESRRFKQRHKLWRDNADPGRTPYAHPSMWQHLERLEQAATQAKAAVKAAAAASGLSAAVTGCFLDRALTKACIDDMMGLQ